MMRWLKRDCPEWAYAVIACVVSFGLAGGFVTFLLRVAGRSA